jgi:predicted nucleic acid-binding protein
MTKETVIYDANIFYPFALRDLFMEVSLTDLYRAKWTNKIHDEWIAAVHRDYPDISLSSLERTRKAINTAVRDCLVEDYEDLIDTVKLPDEDDRHVLAAAIKSGCDVIVTYNVKDFPEAEISKYNIEAQHPDEFLNNLINLSDQKVCQSVQNILDRLKTPPLSFDKYVSILEDKHQLPMFCSELKRYKARF